MPALTYTRAAIRALEFLAGPCADRVLHCQVRRALDKLAADLRHPGLRTRRHHAVPGRLREAVYGSYVGTGSGWRIRWIRTDGGGIEVVAIVPHP
ncbi:hypothetical protein ACFVT9_33775 [Kitasatospora cineracea]|uniref:hypothetical protein n=1 Tax=Kitasatospora cineracea TaxID=88074 RepID=UPI0036D8A42B